MPRRLPYLVIADDLTGAAELAALAHQAGLRAVVLRGLPRGKVKADVIVVDSGTRLASRPAAARKVKAIAQRLRAMPNAGIFKKTDSVLRGNVMAEIEACMTALGLERTLLVPANPSLGRIINQGRYSIGGQQLNRTTFARDPHHPRKSSLVSTLLTYGAATPVCLHPAEPLPDRGVFVGEAGSPADVALWASRLDVRTLPAGGADFFRMWLVQKRAPRRKGRHSPTGGLGHLPAGATLLLDGTSTTNDPASPLGGEVHKLNARRLPPPEKLCRVALSALKTTRQFSVSFSNGAKPVHASPPAIDRLYSRGAQRLHRARGFAHILVAGATTAASVLQSLGWNHLEVIRVWGPGAVTMRPAEAPRCIVTVKPGSYAWPVSLRRYFTPHVPSTLRHSSCLPRD